MSIISPKIFARIHHPFVKKKDLWRYTGGKYICCGCDKEYLWDKYWELGFVRAWHKFWYH